MSSTYTTYELEDCGPCHAQYFEGRGVAYTHWDTVFLGVGFTMREAAEAALEDAAQALTEAELPSSLVACIEEEIAAYPDSADTPVCELVNCDVLDADADDDSNNICDQCELVYFVALYLGPRR